MTSLTSSSTSTSKIKSLARFFRKWRIVISIVFGGLFLFVFYISLQIPEINNYGIFVNYKGKSSKNHTKVILFWNSFFQSRNWYLSNDVNNASFFEEHECPVTNCILTSNHKFLESIDSYDAVLFHGAESFPLLNPIPNIRKPEQLYVLVTIESPPHTKHVLDDETNFYNKTITYRLDSDIVWPYGRIEDIEAEVVVAPALKPKWRQPSKNFTIDPKIAEIISGKTKYAAWFVSHCSSISKRDDLAKALQKFVPVDIYGDCGPLKCPRKSKQCDNALDYDYHFYLSFENSLCTDYVTEKFYNALGRIVVPVVFGGADYNRFAPPYSYINAEEFKTARDLATYLLYLVKNPIEYQKYFWWKKYYRYKYQGPYCDLCEILNNANEGEKISYYKNVKEWWFSNSCYITPKIKFS